jgi:hypothetical protein
VQAPPRCDNFSAIAGIFGLSVLGLEKVDVAAARYIEGMSKRAMYAPGITLEVMLERPAAIANRTLQHVFRKD